MGFSIYSLFNTNDIDDRNQLDKNSLVVLKLPIALPYVSDWQVTENMEAEVLHDQESYHIVSRNIANDTLYVHCIYTESARDRFWGLVSSFDDHLKKSDDSAKNRAGNIMKSLLKEYMSTGRRLTFFIIEWITPETYAHIEIDPEPAVSNVSTPPPNFS